MELLTHGKIKSDVANSIATQSREVCRIAKVQLDYARFAGKRAKPNSMLTN